MAVQADQFRSPQMSGSRKKGQVVGGDLSTIAFISPYYRDTIVEY